VKITNPTEKSRRRRRRRKKRREGHVDFLFGGVVFFLSIFLDSYTPEFFSFFFSFLDRSL